MRMTSKMWMILTLGLAIALPMHAQAEGEAAPKAGEGAKLVSTSTSTDPNATKTPAATDTKTPDGKPATDPDGKEGDVKKDQPEEEPPAKSPFGNMFMFIILGGLILLMFLMSRGRKKQEAKRRAMLEAIKKGDKVVSIGGIVGTIVEVRDTEITVKVDDSTRMKFARWAIRAVGEEAQADKKEDSKRDE